MSEEKSSTITLAGKSYPVVVTIEEMELLKQIEIDLNDKVNQFQKDYAGLSKQDCLALTLIMCSLENHKLQQNQTPQKDDKLLEIKELLDRL